MEFGDITLGAVEIVGLCLMLIGASPAVVYLFRTGLMDAKQHDDWLAPALEHVRAGRFPEAIASLDAEEGRKFASRLGYGAVLEAFTRDGERSLKGLRARYWEAVAPNRQWRRKLLVATYVGMVIGGGGFAIFMMRGEALPRWIWSAGLTPVLAPIAVQWVDISVERAAARGLEKLIASLQPKRGDKRP